MKYRLMGNEVQKCRYVVVNGVRGMCNLDPQAIFPFEEINKASFY